MKQILQNTDLYKSKALNIAKVIKSIREEIWQFGDFPSNCQKDCLPYNMKLLISMILYGPSLKSEENTYILMNVSLQDR